MAVALLCWAGAASAHDEPNGRPHLKGIPANPTAVMRAFMNSSQAAQLLASESNLPCAGGFAGDYPCDGADLLSFTALADIGGDHLGSAGNDIWGWTDPVTGREYALVGRVFGTSAVDVTNPLNPVYLGEVFTHGSVGSSWRDIKVYRDHAFIVSEASGHGMQVYDLAGLRALDPALAPYDLPETAHYGGFGSAHNLAINEDSGFAYAVGANSCGGGLHMVDISDPASPTFAGCFAGDGYTHDAQCVIYQGPDADHQGKEICFAANEDTLTIVDVSDKSGPAQVSRTGYAGRGYTHQGWLSEDQSLYFLDDELDEVNFRHGTRTRIWDVSDLDAPFVIDAFDNLTAAIDHNLYVKGGRIFQANYRAGLSVLDAADALAGNLSEIAYFDVYPADDAAQFNGAWSNYPYFDSGIVVVSGIEQGLFAVLPQGVDFVSFAWPAEGEPVNGDVPVDIKAQDAQAPVGQLTVEWQVDDGAWRTALYNASSRTFEAAWDSGLEVGGPHTLTARMIDLAGEVATSRSIEVVVVADDPPVVTITSPEDGSSVNGNLALTATASDDGAVTGVAFFDDGSKIGDAGFSGGVWSLRWNTKKVPEGSHVITARATDDGGQPGEDAVTVTVGGGGGGDGGGGPNCDRKPDHPKCQV